MKKRYLTSLVVVLAGLLLCSCSSNANKSEAATDTTEESTAFETVEFSTESESEVYSSAEAKAEISMCAEDSAVIPVALNNISTDRFSNEYDNWYGFDSKYLGSVTYGFFRLTDSFMPDYSGNVYVPTYIDYYTDDLSLNVYNVISKNKVGEIEIDEADVLSGDGLSTDVISFEIGGRSFVEVDRYIAYPEDPDIPFHLESKVYAIDGTNMTLGNEVHLLGKNEAITAAFKTNEGTCLAVMRFDTFDIVGSDCQLRFYDENMNVIRVIELDSIGDNEVTYITNLASLDDGNYLVGYYDEEYLEYIAVISPDGEAVDSAFSSLSSSSRFLNLDGKLVIYDDGGMYIYEDDTPLCVYKNGYIMDGYISSMDSYPISINEGDITFLSVKYNNGLNLHIETLSSCAFPYEGREKITVGTPRYLTPVLFDTICEFNGSNDSYYAVPLVISENGIDSPILRSDIDDRLQEIVANTSMDITDEYAYQLASECAFSMELKEFLSGPDAPDVFATEGLWGQLSDSEIMDDLTPIYDALNADDYYMNIFESSQKVGNRFIPVFFYLSGIMDYEEGIERDSFVESLTYNDYQNMVNKKWDGNDPIDLSCTPEQYMEELISVQYDLYVNREQDKTSFGDNDNFNQMMLYLLYSVQPGYDDSDYPDDYFYTSFFAVNDFMYTGVSENGYKMYALPSADSRSIAAEPSLCMGIPSKADDKEGAKAFITYALSYEGQLLCGHDMWGIPVNSKSVQTLMDMCDNDNDAERNAFAQFVNSVSNLYIVDAEVRCACYGPIMALEQGQYDNSDYAPETAGHDIDKNMEYFIQEDY